MRVLQDAAGESVQAILTALEACATALHVASQPSMPQQARSHARASLRLSA
jgi:hypothetical protein